MTTLRNIVLAVFLLGLAGPALASDETDIVRLSNGAFVRGTIIELDPQGEVVIRGADGEIRRYEMSAVAYAGPVGDDAATAPGASGQLQLQLAPAQDQDLRFHRFKNRYDYEPLCAGACELSLDPGPLRLGAALRSRTPREGDLLQIDQDGRIEVRYVDRQPQRIAGLVVAGVGGLTSLGLLTASYATFVGESVNVFGVNDDLDFDEGLAFAALGVGLATAATAFYLILRKDRVESTYVPAQR